MPTRKIKQSLQQMQFSLKHSRGTVFLFWKVIGKNYPMKYSLIPYISKHHPMRKTASWTSVIKPFLSSSHSWHNGNIWDALRDLVPFVKFKKREKHSLISVTYNKLQAEAYNFTKSNTHSWVFSRFLNCINGSKSRKASNIHQ